MGIHNRYSPEVHKFVREHCQGRRHIELAEMCNRELGTSFTPKKMKAFCGNHGYKNGLSALTSEEYHKYHSKWPEGMYEYVRDNSYGVESKDLAKMVNERFGLNLSPQNMKAYCQRMGIKRGLTGWFQKGHAPGNKGVKQADYCSPEALERSKASQFKKGHKPVNQLPVGSIRVNSYGYMLRKKQMEGSQWERWEFLHRAIWEEHNGSIPPGMIVTFIDGDKMNCSIDNLMLVTRSENMMLTHMGLRSEDPDLTEAGLNVTRIKTKLRKIRRSGDIETGARILQAMDERNITQEQMAQMIGVSKYTVNNYIKGYNPVTEPRLWQIARVLGVAKEELRP